ncbi:hypothetical protein B9Q01_07170 [Candidatus Marsarchaeota G1 archaeon OSP_D]|jgi:Protein of unknown function (DUF1641).|uniref:DUF1641 domain-containing protein n=2 Tax=Candidatus Marsarchaeota group 1 TaxID=2203770 RepID=A0A2R6A8S2_9ARCH|nr:MAG: hypothetical protein B9Q01_07170 [Candidatus Marsarchaeota G1 archaeon OSP_D]PSN87593.1 MAG: hypothetical protein B9Q00_08410 [Candidatus Marsarchaeota G1 archaeon OSP_C]
MSVDDQTVEPLLKISRIASELDSLGVFDFVLEFLKDEKSLSEVIDFFLKNTDKLQRITELMNLVLDEKRFDALKTILKDVELLKHTFSEEELSSFLLKAKQLIDTAQMLAPLFSSLSKEELSTLVDLLKAFLSVKNVQPVKGIRGLLRALSDEEVAKGLGVFMEFLRILGKKMLN